MLLNKVRADNVVEYHVETLNQGFSIGGRCLCVIVEPYPPLSEAPRVMSLAPMGLVALRAPSIAPADFVPSGQQREDAAALI